MSLYKEFSTLFPYLQSVRKIQEYLSFDVSFPNSWKLPKKFVDETKVMEQESKVPNQRMFSFVSEIDEISVGKTSDNIQNIIKYNIEREEKEKLFEQKVAELKIIFEKQSLSELKNLSFEFKKTKVKLEDNEDEIRTAGLVQ
jgi:cysteinyl-tRNA synthetase